MSATRKQPSRANKGGIRTSPGERSEEGGRASSHRKGAAAVAAAAGNSPQASVVQREGGQTKTQTQGTQGQRARRRPSRSQQLESKSAAPSSASSAPTLPPPASSVTTATTTTSSSSSNPNPLPSPTTASTTTVKRTLDVAPPTVGPKGIMHDKMVHVSFQPVPETPTSNRTTRAQKREERQQQRTSHPIDDMESDSDSDSPRVKGIFDHPLLPPKKPRKKHKPTTASTKNTSDSAPSSLSNAMDLDLKSTVAQQAPPTPLSAQPLPSPGQGAGSSYWPQPWPASAYGHGNSNATTSSADPTRSTPNPPTPHAPPNTPFTSFPPQAQGWPHVGGITVTPTGWSNPANVPESSSVAAGPNLSYQPFTRVSQPSPSLHDTSPTLVNQSTPQLQNSCQPQPNSDGFVDPGPWYPWKADTRWYDPHPTVNYYRLHEKWFPGAPTLATHPDGQNGGIIYDDGKTYPPSMFVEGRQDLEYFGMGVDPPETMYEFVGTVATARQFHFDDSWAGFDQTARDELDQVGRPLPFITVFEEEMMALVEEFLWRRRRARWLGKSLPSLEPPSERYRHSSSPTPAPQPVNRTLPNAVNAWNIDTERGGDGGEQGYAEGGENASGGPVPGQTPQSYHPSGQPMDYEYPAQGSTQPVPHQQQFQTSPSHGRRAPLVEGGGLSDHNKPTQSPPPGQSPWAGVMAGVPKSSDGTLATALNPPQTTGPASWSAPGAGYPGINYGGTGGNGLGPAAGGHGHSQIPPLGSAIPITPQGWPAHANVGVISGPPIGRGGTSAGPKISPPAIYGDSGRPARGNGVPFGTDITETEDYPGGAVYSELAGQQLQRQQAQQHHPQHPQSRQGSGPIVPPPSQFQHPAPPQRVGSGPQYLPATPGLQPPQHGGQNPNSPYQPPFENSWLDPVIAQQQAATNQQPPQPGQQRSQSQPTSPPFSGPNFSGLNFPPAPNLNGTYMMNGMHHPQFAAAVPGAPGAHPQQFYPAEPAFGGQFGVAQQGFAHH